MMINCVSTNSAGRQYGNILYMVRGIQTQDFLNILNKNNNAKIAISQTGGETAGSVGKLVLGTLSSSETAILNEQQQQQDGTIVRLENSERILKNGQLIIKNVDKGGHSVLVIRSANNDTVPQTETKMSIETIDTMEASSNEDNESKMTASTQKKIALVGSGK